MLKLSLITVGLFAFLLMPSSWAENSLAKLGPALPPPAKPVPEEKVAPQDAMEPREGRHFRFPGGGAQDLLYDTTFAPQNGVATQADKTK